MASIIDLVLCVRVRGVLFFHMVALRLSWTG
jgi:hypothetical protein